VKHVVCGLFLLLTGGAGAWDLLAPVAPPRLAGEELQLARQHRARARISDGSAMRQWSDDIDQRSNLRARLMPFYTGALVRWLAEGTSDVIVGKDGWAFLATRVHPPAHPDKELAGQGARLFAALRRRLAQYGTELLVAPLPRKAVVCAEKLPRGVDPRAGIEQAFARELARLAVPQVDLAAAFSGHSAEELWYREDTHWTCLAQLLAAEAMCAASGLLVPEEQRVGALVEGLTVRDDQSFVRTMGVTTSPLAARWLLPPDEHPAHALVGADGSRIEQRGRRLTINRGVDIRQAAIVGTSFTDGDQLIPYLRHFSGGRIWNGARRGFTVRSTLAQFFREHGPDERPRVLLVEYPTFQLFRHQFSNGEIKWRADELEVFDHLPPRRLSTLSIELSASGPSGRGKNLVNLPSGALSSAGDGVFLVRVTGRPRGAAARVRLRYDAVESMVGWPADKDELLLPLISWRANQSSVSAVLLGADGPPATVELVTEFDLDARTPLRVQPPAAAGGVWTQELRFARPVALAPHTGLVLDVHAQYGARGRVAVQLVPADDADAPRAVERIHLAPRGLALLEIANPGARRFRAIRLSGTGEPGPGVRRAGLVPLPVE
jgi:hypothetical protein